MAELLIHSILAEFVLVNKRSAVCDPPEETPFDLEPDVVFVDTMILWGFKQRLQDLTEAAGMHMPQILRFGPFSLAYNVL